MVKEGWTFPKFITKYKHLSPILPSNKWKMFEFTWSPPVHSCCRIGFGTRCLLEQLLRRWWASGGARLGSEVLLVLVVEILPAGWGAFMVVVDGLPCVFEDLVDLGEAGGEFASLGVVVDGGVGAVVVFDKAKVRLHANVLLLCNAFLDFGGEGGEEGV